MDNLLIAFLAGMLGVEFLEKITNKQNIVSSFYLLFSFFFTTIFIFFYTLATITSYIHSSGLNPSSIEMILTVLFISFCLTISTYGMVRLKKKDEKE
jgi:quinol-cytochrome oxidoreductase complex cytochrome b subunit